MTTTTLDGVPVSARVFAIAELAVIISVFWFVRDLAREAELIGAGSMGILSAVAAGTIMMKLRGRSWRDYGLSKPEGFSGWGLTVLLTVAVMAAVILGIPTVVIPAINALLDNPNFHGVGGHFEFLYGRPLVFVTYLILVAWIGAAFGEELFARGLMMNQIAEIFGNTKFAWALALLGQAVFFGTAHAYQGTVGMLLTGSVGLIFGIFYLIGRRNLIPLIIAHGLIDTLGLTQLYLANSVAT